MRLHEESHSAPRTPFPDYSEVYAATREKLRTECREGSEQQKTRNKEWVERFCEPYSGNSSELLLENPDLEILVEFEGRTLSVQDFHNLLQPNAELPKLPEIGKRPCSLDEFHFCNLLTSHSFKRNPRASH